MRSKGPAYLGLKEAYFSWRIGGEKFRFKVISWQMGVLDSKPQDRVKHNKCIHVRSVSVRQRSQ